MAFYFGPIHPTTPLEDGLYLSESDLSYRHHPVHFQQHLTHLENSAKGHFYPSYAWEESCAFPIKMELHSPIPIMDRYPSPWTAGPSSISGPDSPRSTGLGQMAYPSPPYIQEDNTMIPEFSLDYTYPSPPALAGLGHSIAPSDVQRYPEHVDQVAKVEPDEMHSYHVLQHSSPDYSPVIKSEDSYEPLPSPPSRPAQNVRRRASKSSKSNRVTKASRPRRLSARGPARALTRKQPSKEEASDRVFVCSFAPYGCTSTFASKNEWKRHVTSQHIQLGFFRCDVGCCNTSTTKKGKGSKSRVIDGDDGEPRRPNDFNRKDLFTQHQRRMHAPWLNRKTNRTPSEEERQAFEKELEDVRTRCWHQQRHSPPQSQCGFCDKQFSGPRGWDDRMEHVGRHFEKNESLPEQEDLALRQWALHEGIIRPEGGSLKLASLCDSS